MTRVPEREAFIDLAIGARPDYLVTAAGTPARDVLPIIAERSPSSPVAVLLIEDGTPVADIVHGISAEPVSPDSDPADLALTLRALLRRTRPQALVGRSSWRDLALDEACLSFAVREARVSLSLEIFCVFGAMMDDPGRVWSRSDLHRLVFGAASRNDIRALDMRISRARRHVSSALGVDPIRSVRGVGYALVGEP